MKNNQKKESLIELLDTVFVVAGEMIENNGEDSYVFSINEEYGLIGVFDGCGGIGSRKYATYANKTGAYIASHAIAEAASDWFHHFCKSKVDLSGNNIHKICVDIRNKFNEELKIIESAVTATSIKGSLAKSFPTTVSMLLLKCRGNSIYSSFIWAGDSRGFVLTTQGLSQITIDDIEGNDDALSNLSNDGRLTNVVSASGDYSLNNKLAVCADSAILITATDGCFGYFSTPMEFEYMILSSLEEAHSVNEWKDKMNKFILNYTGDDYTLGIAAFGYKNFKNMKRAFVKRKKHLYKNYISKLDNMTENEKIKLWNRYKKDYYRGVY